MRAHRRQFVRLAGAAAALVALSPRARAQAYPAQPLRWVVGFPPGGGADIVSRHHGAVAVGTARPASRGREQAGRQHAIFPSRRWSIRRPTATRCCSFRRPRPSTSTLFDKLPFNLLRDIAPVSGLIDFPLVMVANPSLPAKTVAELIAHAKANPGKISIASFGTGSTSHVAGELFKMMAGVNMIHVPYRGGAAMIADLIGGQVQVGLDVMTAPLAAYPIGRAARAGGGGKARSDALPDVPTIGETVAGYEANSWCGVGVPRARHPRSSSGSTARSMPGLADPAVKARLAECRHHADRLHSRGVRRLYGGRGGEVGQGGQGIGHQAGVIGRPLEHFGSAHAGLEKDLPAGA